MVPQLPAWVQPEPAICQITFWLLVPNTDAEKLCTPMGETVAVLGNTLTVMWFITVICALVARLGFAALLTVNVTGLGLDLARRATRIAGAWDWNRPHKFARARHFLQRCHSRSN